MTRGSWRGTTLAWLMIAASLAAVAAPTPAGATAPPGFQLVDAFTGLDRPVAMEFAPDGRVFIAEKDGKLKVYDGLGDSSPSQILDWRTKINSNHDRGLLGLAIDPQFANGRDYVYLFYTYDALPGANNAPVHGDDCPGWETTGCTVTAKLSRIQVSQSNAMVGPEQMLLEDKWCIQYNSHSNGDLEFGPDGNLYASAGEGASYVFVDYGQNGNNPCKDPPYPAAPTTSTGEGGALRAQDLLTSTGGEANDPVSLGGTVLRLNPDTGGAASGNPLAGGPIAGDDSIIAHGLRNPFRFAFRPGTSEIWLGDVGWFAWEEVNRISNVSDGVVENFGWPCYEGTQPHSGYASLTMCNRIINNTLNPVVATTKTAPFFTYGHTQTVSGCAPTSSSVSAIAFEDGSNYPADYDGALFFGDYSRGCIWTMKTGADGVPDPGRISTLLTDVRPTDLEVGPGGDLFVVDPGFFGNGEGRIRRLQYVGANGRPAASITVDPTTGTAGSTVFHFDAGKSQDPDGDPLTYQWDLDGNGSFDASGVRVDHVYPQAGTRTVRLRVTDPGGARDEATVVVNVSNSPPVATIIAPTPATHWAVGDTLSFAGLGFDAEDGILGPAVPGREWEWTVLLHHCPSECHKHVEATWTGIAGGTFVVPDHEYPSYLEFVLTVRDSTGASASTQVLVQPKTSVVNFATSPPGLALTVGSQASARPAPFAVTSLVGSQMSVRAPSPQIHNGLRYAFRSWSDGGGAAHDVIVPAAATTLTARFLQIPRSTPGMVDATGRWRIVDKDGIVRSFYFGAAGDLPLIGDWDCDGIDTPGAYRQSTGLVYLRNRLSTGPADISFVFGIPGDIPIAGDFNGDGCDTVSVFRKSHVYIVNSLGQNGGALSTADYDYWFGIPGDVPFTGDFDGDGIDELGLFRKSVGYVYMTLNPPTADDARTDLSFYYGAPGDRIIAGDWNNNGTDTVGIYRASTNTFYLRNANSTGPAHVTVAAPVGATPVAGQFLFPG